MRFTFKALKTILKELKDELSGDVFYFRHDFNAHGYSIHFFLGLAFQLVFMAFGLMLQYDWGHLMLLTSLLHLGGWLFKELTATQRGLGILPVSFPDWRDARMSGYGIIAANLIILPMILFLL